MNDRLSEQYATSPLYGGNAPYVEALYEQYLRDAGSVSAQWREYFDRIRGDAAAESVHGPVIASERRGRASPPPVRNTQPAPNRAQCRDSSRCMQTAAT
jgi:2-oxoglutarate dehydrogenase E1 component